MMVLLVVVLVTAACATEAETTTTAAPPETSLTTPPDNGEGATTMTQAAETTEAPPELTQVRVALPTSSYFITTVGVQFALQNGYFEEEGLDVTVDPLPGSTTAIRSLLSGDHDIALTGGDTAYNAWNNGAPIKIISSPVSKGTDVMIANSDVESIEDMAGRRFGISEPGSTSELLGRIIFERNGVDPDSIQWVSLGDPSARVTAMLADEIDAAAITIVILEPVLEAIESGEMKVLTSFAEEFPDVPLAYNVTSDPYLAENPDVVERFLRAEIRGYCWAQQNPEQAAEIAVDFIEETPLELMIQGMQGMADLGVWGIDGGMTPEGIAATQEALIQLGNLEETVEVDDVAVFDLVEAAAAAVDCPA